MSSHERQRKTVRTPCLGKTLQPATKTSSATIFGLLQLLPNYSCSQTPSLSLFETWSRASSKKGYNEHEVSETEGFILILCVLYWCLYEHPKKESGRSHNFEDLSRLLSTSLHVEGLHLESCYVAGRTENWEDGSRWWQGSLRTDY